MVCSAFFNNMLLVTVIYTLFNLNVAFLHDDTLTLNQVDYQTESSSYRLPEEIVPVSYDLWINTSLGVNDFSYQGYVKIEVRVLELTDKIIVHNEGLIIQKDKSTFCQHTVNSIDFIRINDQLYDKERQFYIIKFEESLNPGEYALTLYFNGTVLDDVFGFYRSAYDVNGATKWMGVTQFSPTYVRRAFPCMDEPQLKATFTLHIGHTENQTATSNTEIKNIIIDSNNANYRTTTFLPTPRIPTYIVGWIVHEFVSDTSNASQNFKIWSRPSMNHHGSITLNQGQAIYSSLEKWLIENPISKMDQFAVPDFNFNAMENWGLITYRESVVLSENNVTSTKRIITGLTTMAHEYAHTWFGNLVTPKFWDVAWLKEGFASYFQYFGISLVEPSWEMMEMFVVDILQPTLLLDSANHNRTMNEQNIGSPSSIMSMLDFVSYKKGASIIRMLCHVIETPAFQEGLRKYLKDMSYAAAEPFDLYKRLQDSLDKSDTLYRNISIRDIIESWANQPGYPLVTITRNYSTQSLIVSQEQFRRNSSDPVLDSKRSRWWIPLNFATQSKPVDFFSTTTRTWLRPQDKSLILNPFKSEGWVIFNVQQIGFYRVNYDANNWRLLTDYLRSKEYRKIHKINRAALLDDAFNLARAGYIDYSIPFNLSKYLIQESEYEPWVAATNNFNFLNEILSNVPKVHRSFQEYILGLLEPMYKKLSFNEAPCDDLRTKLHRELILSASCSANNTECLKTSKGLFESWISTPDKTILPDIKSFVYCVGIRLGNENDWHEVWNRFLHTDLHTEQELLLRGLGCTQSPDLINRYLDSAISLEYDVRKQYRIVIINAILDGNPNNVDYVLKFVQSNFKKILYLRGHTFLSKVITAIGNKMTTYEQAEKLRSFVDDNTEELGAILSTANDAIVSAVTNAKWVEKYASNIDNSLMSLIS